MDGQPTRKKSKGGQDIVSFFVQPDGVSQGDPKKDYFIPAIMDFWPKILEYVTDPEDVLSVMNASSTLRDLLKKRTGSALLPLVLPILLKQNPLALTPRDVFNCRLVSKKMKAAADDVIGNDCDLRSRCIRRNSWMLMDRVVIQEFINGTQDFTGNPFLARLGAVILDHQWGEQLTNVMEIYRRFGHQLLNANLHPFIRSSPRQAMRVLKRTLRYLPNVERLVLCFPLIEEWQNYAAELSPFPSLEALRILKLLYWDDNYPGIIPPHGSFVRPILRAYGKQLTNLACGSLVFKGEPWGILHFPNLLDLDVSFNLNKGADADELSQIFKNLAKLCCPKLERLTLSGNEMRLTLETFLALKKFRASLEELQMDNLEGDLKIFQVDPSNVRIFPKLRRLTLCTVNVGTEWIRVFRFMFPFLEEIRFLPPIANIDRRSRIAVQPPIPDETLARSYYFNFRKLKRILWHQSTIRGGANVDSIFVVGKSGTIQLLGTCCSR